MTTSFRKRQSFVTFLSIFLSFVSITIVNVTVNAQDSPTERAQPIVREGKELYRSEMASWYGTDIFLEKYKDKANIGGYFSYSENNKSKFLFMINTCRSQ